MFCVIQGRVNSKLLKSTQGFWLVPISLYIIMYPVGTAANGYGPPHGETDEISHRSIDKVIITAFSRNVNHSKV